MSTDTSPPHPGLSLDGLASLGAAPVLAGGVTMSTRFPMSGRVDGPAGGAKPQRKTRTSLARHRHRSRGWESSLVDALLLLGMLAGCVAAALGLVLAVGCAVGIFSL